MKKLYVIGSSSSLSEALARLSDDFSPVFIGRSNPHKLKSFIPFGGVTDESSIEELTSLIATDVKAHKDIKSVSLVVLSGVSSHDWRESFLVNEYLPAKLSENFAQLITKGDFVNSSVTLVGSSAAHLGAKMTYATTKAALAGVVHTIARDYRGKVRINLVLPSAFESEMIADWDDEKRKSVANNNYIGRLGTANDMADAVLFAVRNEFITNSTINMTGGTVHI